MRYPPNKVEKTQSGVVILWYPRFMGRPKVDHSASICSVCTAVGTRLIKGNCPRCYRKAYFKNVHSIRHSKAARTAKSREWRAANPEKWKALVKKHNSPNKWFLWKYGLTHAQYLALRDNQNGLCALCQKQAKRLVMDHDHVTDQLRQFVCDRCNMLLGFIEKTEPEILEAALGYLKRHKTKV